ncbi:DNA-packaging protein [Neomegalonema perideroedes]|uniref:DNA-packaging protein n=1 Tax=Neomegalonema perideroedes TaxID=217219 RepID=UPI0003802CF7|nr:terminase family protein [Neomegalonema perideroedes]
MDLLSTSPPPGATSWADWLASLPPEAQARFLDSLPPESLSALPWLFELWRRPSQSPPPGSWRTWVFLGGRGAGKTRAGAEWVRGLVEGPTPLSSGARRRVALMAETADQAREVMVQGESGLMSATPPDRRPTYLAARRALIWPNGAEARLFSAADPESLRGPQFDAAWCDELGKWRRAEAAWDMLQFGLRLGDAPQALVTTTPRRNPVLETLLADSSTAVTRAPTSENAAHLAPAFLSYVRRRYGGTSLGRQELEGELLTEAPGALWSAALLDASRAAEAPPLDRVVVAVDPPILGGPQSDACGIVVAGAVMEGEPSDWTAYVLADWSARGKSPAVWAERAATAFAQFRADRLVAEINQGGDMVETILRQSAPNIPFRGVYATRGKRLRAEPVAALYEQGRIRHVGLFPELEDQMRSFGASGLGPGMGRSPDRLDALVWAITDLLLSAPPPAPRVRGL